MIFDKPTPFAEALNSVKARVLLPTDLSSAELGEMDASLHERSLTLARVTNTTFLQSVSDVTEQIVLGKLTRDAGRRQLKALVVEMGEDGLLNSARLNLIIRMQVESAFGYGQWRQAQSRQVLEAWPAQEFYRAEWRKEPRNWPERWREAGGTFFHGGGSYAQGRMIAMKDSSIWETISRFGTPYAPFDFNSGMDIRGVKRSEAVALGLMKPDAPAPQPQKRDFEKDFGSELDSLTPELKDALLESLGEDYKFDDDVLTYANCAPVMLIMAFAANANPTAAQIRAGNYKMKHLKVNGLNISIENPAGSVRSGTDAKGNQWRSVLPLDYGYIKRTEGADGDAVDCFVGTVASPLVHIVDQQDPWTMKFDEHKVFLNVKDADDARKNYLLAFGDGSGGARIKSFVTMGFDEFKDWLKTAKTKKPVVERNAA